KVTGVQTCALPILAQLAVTGLTSRHTRFFWLCRPFQGILGDNALPRAASRKVAYARADRTTGNPRAAYSPTARNCLVWARARIRKRPAPAAPHGNCLGHAPGRARSSAGKGPRFLVSCSGFH